MPRIPILKCINFHKDFIDAFPERTKKPAFTKAGLHHALAVFFKRPQAVLQIGADRINYLNKEYAYIATKSN